MDIPQPHFIKQLGHTDALTIARHYARWMDATGRYVEPPVLQPAEVATGLQAQLGQRGESMWRGRGRGLNAVQEPRRTAVRTT